MNYQSNTDIAGAAFIYLSKCESESLMSNRDFPSHGIIGNQDQMTVLGSFRC